VRCESDGDVASSGTGSDVECCEGGLELRGEQHDGYGVVRVVCCLGVAAEYYVTERE